jgi:hypothetical protein
MATVSADIGGRPSKRIQRFQDIIEQLYIHEDQSAKHVIEHLAEEYGFIISLRSFRTAIADWQYTKRETYQDTPELRARISTCFYLLGLSDSETFLVLTDEGCNSFILI